MNNCEHEIETALRRAPKPTAPAGLKERLSAEVDLPAESVLHTERGLRRLVRRWWAVLLPAAVSVACASVIILQQREIKQLKQANQELAKKSSQHADEIAPEQEAPAITPIVQPVDYRAEIARLKDRAEQLTHNVTQLEQMRSENDALRTKLAAPPENWPPEFQLMEEARDKAMRIRCVNNLKQFGLAVRIWEMDNTNMFPPDVLSMSNELNTPKILVCPADTARQPAPDWNSFTSANCTYEYLTPSAQDAETEPTRVLSRCPIHGTVGLCDGSVQQVGTNHPEWFVRRDGKLYFEPNHR